MCNKLVEDWQEKISDSIIVNIIADENTEYFGYMDVDTLKNTSLENFLDLYCSYNEDEGIKLFYKLQKKIKDCNNNQWIDIHSGKVFNSSENMVDYIRNNDMNSIRYYVENIKYNDDDFIRELNCSIMDRKE